MARAARRPGIPVPEALWAEAVEAARVAGVDATARALRLNRSRLAARMTIASRPAPVVDVGQATPLANRIVLRI
jgi:hypothetical protein